MTALTAQKPCTATAFRRITAKCSLSRYRLRMAIEFDVEELIGKVDAITATQLPLCGPSSDVPARQHPAD